MAIKIDGQKNTIKAELGTYVKVSNSLFVNDNPVDENGGLGEKTYHITRNGWYPVSEYSTCDVVKIDVTNYDYYAGYGTPYETYEECKLNGSSYTVDDSFLLKKGINVIVPSPAPDPKPEGPEGPKEYSYSFGENVMIDPARNYEKTINFDFKENCQYKYSYSGNITCYYTRNADPLQVSIVINNSSGGVEEGYINYEFKKESTSITFLVKVSVKELAGYTFTPTHYVLSNIKLVIQEIPNSTTPATLSLHQSYTSDTSFMENLIVNNDALIEGNLSVEGYINDIQWMWDEVAFTNPIMDLQNGFFARLNNCSFTTTDDVVQIPSLQLSPGGEYKHSNYKITWSGDGLFTIQSDQEITNCTGLINILRYK